MAMYTQREIDLAWAAGFFDGEGCFYAHYYKPRADGSKVYRMAASVVQKDVGLLQRFQTVLGFGIVYGPSTKGLFTWKTGHRREAATVAALLRPWLSERRRLRAEELLQGEESQVFRPLSSTCVRGHPYTPENTVRRRGRSGRECRQCINDNARHWRARQPIGYWRKWPSQDRRAVGPYEDAKIKENGDVYP